MLYSHQMGQRALFTLSVNTPFHCFLWCFREVQKLMHHVLVSNIIPVTHCVCFIFVHLQVVLLLKFIRLI